MVKNIKIVANEEKYYMFIRELRTHKANTNGFLEQVEITPEQQIKYMSKHKDKYFICLDENETPIGFVGEIDGEIRFAVDPTKKNMGVGTFMINSLVEINENIYAKVLLANLSSSRVFEKCGFIKKKQDEKFIYYEPKRKVGMEYNRPLHNPFKVVRLFEEEIARYTGAKYAVSVDSCTNALFLCLMYQKHIGVKTQEIIIPSKTYLSVPQSIIHAGFEPIFDTSKNDWVGIYQLGELPIYDSAKRFTSNMYIDNSFMCLSFHIKKHLKIGKGGMILTNDVEAVEWFKMARYEGRTEKLYHEDDITMLGWNMYMTPQEASHGLALMQNFPIDVSDLSENNGYRDLTEFTVFKKYKKI